MTSDPPPHVSVVLPAYRLGPVIYQNVLRVASALGSLPRVEIVVVDDGSSDGTYEEARRAAVEVAEVAKVVVVRHPVNRGKGEALATGAREASGAVVVLLDGDLDLPPEQVPALLERLGDADVLVGAKQASMGGDYPWKRRMLSKAFVLLTDTFFRLPIRETQTGLKVFRRPVLDRVLPEVRVRGYTFDLELLVRAHRAGYRLTEVPVELSPGAASGALRPAMLWELGRDTLRIFWWTLRKKKRAQ